MKTFEKIPGICSGEDVNHRGHGKPYGVSLGTFKSQNLRSTETMERLASGNSATQDMLWVLIAAGACIYAISFFATQEWALALNLPV